MTKRLISGLATIVMMFTVLSCGGDDADDGGTTTDEGGAEASETADDAASDAGSASGGDFDESSLPDDFPTELIPPTYDTGSYVNLGGTNTATFTSGTPIADTIAHYTDVVGEPDVPAVEGDEGEMSAIWHHEGWVVSLVGGPAESIIGISKVAG